MDDLVLATLHKLWGRRYSRRGNFCENVFTSAQHEKAVFLVIVGQGFSIAISGIAEAENLSTHWGLEHGLAE